jgi:hypothetical protein
MSAHDTSAALHIRDPDKHSDAADRVAERA